MQAGWGSKALGIVGISPKEEKVTAYLQKRFKEQPGMQLTPQQARELHAQTQSGIMEFKSFDAQAKKIVFNKRYLAAQIGGNLLGLRKLFSENLIPTPQQKSKLPGVEQIASEIARLEGLARQYALLTKIILNVVLHEYRKIEVDAGIDRQFVRGWEIDAEVNLINELGIIIKEVERLNIAAQEHLGRFDSANIALRLREGLLDITRLRGLVSAYYELERVEAEILAHTERYTKQAGKALNRTVEEAKAMKAMRGQISDWNTLFGSAKRHSWLTVQNGVAVAGLVGIACSFGLVAPLVGPAKALVNWGEKIFFSREQALVEIGIDAVGAIKG